MLFVALAWSLAQVPEPPAPVDAVLWVAPPGCPGRAALLAGVERRRGRPLAPGQVRVDGAVTAGPGKRFTLAITLITGAREDRRTLTADRCAALVDAAALLIAVAIDGPGAATPAAGDVQGEGAPAQGDAGVATGGAAGDGAGTGAATGAGTGTGAATGAGTGTGGGAEGAAPGTGGAAEGAGAGTNGGAEGAGAETNGGTGTAAPVIAGPEEARPVIAEPAGHERPMPPLPRLGGFVRFQGGLALGTVPGASGAASLAMGLLWKRARLEVQPLFVAPRTVRRAEHDLRASLVAVGVSGCFRVVAGPRAGLEVPLCAGLEGGVMHGAAAGADGERGALGGWFAVLAGVAAVWRVHRKVGLMLGVQGAGVVWRTKFLLSGSAGEVELFRPLPVSMRVLAGVELRFGDPR